MPDEGSIHFPPFRFDLAGRQLYRGLEEVSLRPKATAILIHFLARPRQLISKADLLAAVWGQTQVSPDTLRSTLRELRSALGEDPRSPRFIETVHGRGYRFIATVEAPSDPTGPATPEGPVGSTLVGRTETLARLHEHLAVAASGRRQVVFLSGEAGIGKTAVVEAFVSGTRERARAAYGRCIIGYGDSESYLPLLEALGRLCRQPGGQPCIDLLEEHAPTWLVELPGIVDATRLRRLRSRIVRVNQDRMLRELVDAVEAICAEQPLTLFLDDLHWSDAATLSAIDALARGLETARLLLIATHRPVVHDGDGARLASLRAELLQTVHCSDLPLPLLSADDTATYLSLRFPGASKQPDLFPFIHGRSDGNALMMVSYADELVRTGRLVESDRSWRLDGEIADLPIPRGIRQMIEHQIAQLGPDTQQALEDASILGTEFSVDAIEGVDSEDGRVDRALTLLAREGSFVHIDAAGLRFTHGLYQELLYERTPRARRRKLHLRLAFHLEAIAGSDTAPVAAALAMHFERGGEPERAIRYLRQLAEIAIQRSAHAEAEILLRRALALSASLPVGPVRDTEEFRLLALLGNVLTLTLGYVDPEVSATYSRAFDASAEIDGETPELITVLAGLCGFYALRGEHQRAIEITDHQLRIAEESTDPYDRVVSSVSRSIACFSLGRYEESALYAQSARKAYRPDRHGPANQPVATDVGVQGLGHGSLVLAAGGRLDEARLWSLESLALARQHEHPPSELLAYFYAMMFEQLLQDVDRTEAHATACLESSAKYGYPYYMPHALVVSGWAQARRGRAEPGWEQASQGVALLKAAGAVLGQPLFCSMLAEVCAETGRIDDGLRAVSDGLEVVDTTGEIASAAALHWQHGELMLRAANGSAPTTTLGKAESCLEEGIGVARRCGAPVQALGPAISLARSWSESGRRDDARQLLEESLRGFTSMEPVPVLAQAQQMHDQLCALRG